MLKTSIATTAVVFILTLFAVQCSAQQNTIVISAETPVNIISAPGNDKAVGFMSEFLAAAVPAKIVVSNKPGNAASNIQIHIGRTDYAKKLNLNSQSMAEDEFVIAFPNRSNIVIVGGSEYGTMYGVTEFLERFAGVRWLFPGQLGLHIPKHEKLTVPMQKISQKPAFIMRTLSGHIIEKAVDWRMFNRQHRTIKFHHNLYRLFAADTYTKTHPEFFPLVNGTRVLPKHNKDQSVQPNLNEPGTVKEAIKNICTYFKQNPSATSYSLGMNDTMTFGDEAKAGDTNSVGCTSYSDYYYDWVNKVVAGVTKQYPDKWFGLLAYFNVTDPPTKIKLNPRVIPFICIDRMTWYDPQKAANDKQRTIEWHKQASVLGWYDYIYGDHFYIVPRIYFQLMTETIRFGYENGVRAYYAEIYNSAAWREGPKAYLVLKLLWNPYIDVDATLNDWYRCAVGDAAAPDLKAYFELWESYWKNQVPKTNWFKKGAKTTYLWFHEKGYLEYLKQEDLAKCEKLLAAVVAKASTPEQKARADFFMDGFKGIKKQIEKATSFIPAKPTP